MLCIMMRMWRRGVGGVGVEVGVVSCVILLADVDERSTNSDGAFCEAPIVTVLAGDPVTGFSGGTP